MISEGTDNDILEQFRGTSNKLKKRFLRKPNETEACESFSQLGQQCEKAELPSYAGMCWMAAARCEASLGNPAGEGSALIRAGQQFWKAEEKENSIGCFSPAGENCHAAASCLVQAADCYPEDVPNASGLFLEIAQKCDHLGHKDEVEICLKRAVELSKNNFDTRRISQDSLASYYIEQGRHTEALHIYSELLVALENQPQNGAKRQAALQYEIFCTLLLLILRPGPQKISTNQAKLLEKYTWGDYKDKVCGMDMEKFILIQSLVVSCQSLDTSNLQHLENDLFPLLPKQGQRLLRVLVRIYLKE